MSSRINLRSNTRGGRQGNVRFKGNTNKSLSSSTSVRAVPSESIKRSTESLLAEKALHDAEIRRICDIWTSLQHYRRTKAILAPAPLLDYGEWRRERRHPVFTTDPRNGLCKRTIKLKVEETDLSATRRKLTFYKPVDSETCFRFVDMKGEPRRRLQELQNCSSGISAFASSSHTPVFASQWFSPSVRMPESDEIFDPAKRHPAAAGFTFAEETSDERKAKEAEPLNPKTCSRRSLVEELLLPQILKQMDSLLRLLRHDFRFERKNGKVNACDFLAFRLYLHNPNHPERLLQIPRPLCIGEVPFFADISIRDLSCDSRRNSAEKLLAEILAVGIDDDDDNDEVEVEVEGSGEEARDSKRSGDNDAGLKIEDDNNDDETGGDAEGTTPKKNSRLETRNSQTFLKLAGRLKNGEIFYYQRLLTRQLQKEESYRQRHKFTRRNRFYRVVDKWLTPDEAAVIIQKNWRRYLARSIEEISELVVWQREWRIIRDLMLILEPPVQPKAIADVTPVPYCKGDEYRCHCDCGADGGGGGGGEAPECRCIEGRGLWKRPAPTDIPGNTYKKEKTLEIQHEGRSLRFSYVERGKPSSSPSLLFLHDLCAKKSVWRVVQRALADEQNDFSLTNEQHMIAVDLPGHGHSSYEYDWGQTEEDKDVIDMIIDLMNVFIESTSLANGQIHLVGHSFGGSIAILMAERFPTKIAQLTLIAPAVTTYPRPSAFARGLRSTRWSMPSSSSSSSSSSAKITLRSFYLPTTYEEMELCLNHSFFDVKVAEGFSDRTIEARLVDIGLKRRSYKRMLQAFWRQLNEVNRILPKIRVPTVIIWGLEDHYFDPCGARVLEDQLGGKSCVFLLPGIGHGAPEEASLTIARQIAKTHNNSIFFEDILP